MEDNDHLTTFQMTNEKDDDQFTNNQLNRRNDKTGFPHHFGH